VIALTTMLAPHELAGADATIPDFTAMKSGGTMMPSSLRSADFSVLD